MHIPFDKFNEEKAEELVKVLVEREAVVFLCMWSKQPGPSCASDYARVRVKFIENNEVEKQRVLVLSGGMNAVMKEWCSSETAGAWIEGYDESMWKKDTNIGLIHVHDFDECCYEGVVFFWNSWSMDRG